MNRFSSLSLGAALLVSFACGCTKEQAPQLLPAEQVTATVENAFKEADPELQNSAKEVVSALQGKDEPKALIDLQALFARPDLTPAQREAASQSMMSLNEKLRAAAAQGDQRAAEALQIYRARK